MSNEVYANYATALYELVDSKDLPTYVLAIKDLRESFDENPSFLKVLSSYEIPFKQKETIIEIVVGSIHLAYLSDFIKVVTKHHRISHFDLIAAEFVSLANEKLGIIEGIIYSVSRLEKDELSRIAKALEEKLGKKVELRNIVDASLIGGIKVAINGQVYDSSLKYKLHELEAQLLQGGITK